MTDSAGASVCKSAKEMSSELSTIVESPAVPEYAVRVTVSVARFLSLSGALTYTVVLFTPRVVALPEPI